MFLYRETYFVGRILGGRVLYFSIVLHKVGVRAAYITLTRRRFRSLTVFAEWCALSDERRGKTRAAGSYYTLLISASTM